MHSGGVNVEAARGTFAGHVGTFAAPVFVVRARAPDAPENRPMLLRDGAGAGHHGFERPHLRSALFQETRELLRGIHVGHEMVDWRLVELPGVVAHAHLVHEEGIERMHIEQRVEDALRRGILRRVDVAHRTPEHEKRRAQRKPAQVL